MRAMTPPPAVWTLLAPDTYTAGPLAEASRPITSLPIPSSRGHSAHPLAPARPIPAPLVVHSAHLLPPRPIPRPLPPFLAFHSAHRARSLPAQCRRWRHCVAPPAPRCAAWAWAWVRPPSRGSSYSSSAGTWRLSPAWPMWRSTPTGCSSISW